MENNFSLSGCYASLARTDRERKFNDRPFASSAGPSRSTIPGSVVNLLPVPFPTRSFRQGIDLLSRALDVSTSPWQLQLRETRLISQDSVLPDAVPDHARPPRPSLRDNFQPFHHLFNRGHRDSSTPISALERNFKSNRGIFLIFKNLTDGLIFLARESFLKASLPL